MPRSRRHRRCAIRIGGEVIGEQAFVDHGRAADITVVVRQHPIAGHARPGRPGHVDDRDTLLVVRARTGVHIIHIDPGLARDRPAADGVDDQEIGLRTWAAEIGVGAELAIARGREDHGVRGVAERDDVAGMAVDLSDQAAVVEIQRAGPVMVA